MLECDHLDVSFGAVQVLHSVNLRLEKGEFVALLGANGAGKTTLLRTFSGLVRPQRGTVKFEGTSIDNVGVESRVEMGIAHAPERRRIFPGLTVLENLQVATASWRSLSMSIDDDLEKVFTLFPRLKERRKQLGWSLSGGEQQMLAIGRALMSRPQVLLLDEPSLGLAPLIAEEVYARLQKIGETGMTTLVVEQNTALALEVATRAYVLEHGRIVLQGTSSELANHPRVREAYLGS